MNFPASRHALKSAGYVFRFARACKRCGKHLEFYLTPNQAVAPMEVVIIGREWLLDSHFKTCPFRDEFSKKMPSEKPPTTGDLFGGKP